MNENEEEAWASIDHNYDAKKAEKENLKAQKNFFKIERQYIYKHEKEVVYWELKDGKQIDIDQMTVEHLRNALKLIVNKKLLKEKL